MRAHQPETGSKPPATNVAEEFRAVRRRQLLVMIPGCVLLLGAMFVFTQMQKQDSKVFATIFIVIAALDTLAIIAFSLWNWRCPACRGRLGRGFSHRFCRNCGAQLS